MCRSAHILRVTVHIPANTTAGTYAQSLSNFYPGGTSRTTKVHEVRVSIMDAWHTSPQTPPTAGPPLAPMTNIFFRRQDRNHPEKQRRHARDDTNALPSLGHQDRARVRPDQDRPSGSSAATRTSPTRPRTAMTTHASTTGSKITDTLVGDSSPGQHPKPEYVL